jgi:hypothetical protein
MVRVEMSTEIPDPKSDTSSGWQKHDYPNYPEVSGTTLPLLSTVLAGFAVTIIVQLVLLPDDTDTLPARVVIALITFLLALLSFLLATAFAVNAQANNYLPFIDLSEASKDFLNVDNPGEWLQRIERRWYVYQFAALYTFYGGVVLLLAGVNLILWQYIGATIAVIFLLAALASFGITLAVGRLAESREETESR